MRVDHKRSHSPMVPYSILAEGKFFAEFILLFLRKPLACIYIDVNIVLLLKTRLGYFFRCIYYCCYHTTHLIKHFEIQMIHLVTCRISGLSFNSFRRRSRWSKSRFIHFKTKKSSCKVHFGIFLQTLNRQ